MESVTDASGTELKIQAYDPFGSRRASDWTRAMTETERTALAGEAPQRTARGYTGHEHLERTGLIHMNGRVYDPAIGRFLSPDPIVADASFSQSWNAYSYALNSPLSYSDPSGMTLVGGCPRSVCDAAVRPEHRHGQDPCRHHRVRVLAPGSPGFGGIRHRSGGARRVSPLESARDASGTELKIQAYDPFGSRRASDWTRAMTETERTALAGEAPQRTARGYTLLYKNAKALIA